MADDCRSATMSQISAGSSERKVVLASVAEELGGTTKIASVVLL